MNLCNYDIDMCCCGSCWSLRYVKLLLVIQWMYFKHLKFASSVTLSKFVPSLKRLIDCGYRKRGGWSTARHLLCCSFYRWRRTKTDIDVSFWQNPAWWTHGGSAYSWSCSCTLCNWRLLGFVASILDVVIVSLRSAFITHSEVCTERQTYWPSVCSTGLTNARTDGQPCVCLPRSSRLLASSKNLEASCCLDLVCRFSRLSSADVITFYQQPRALVSLFTWQLTAVNCKNTTLRCVSVSVLTATQTIYYIV